MGFFDDFDFAFDPLDPFGPLGFIIFDEVTKEKNGDDWGDSWDDDDDDWDE